VDAIDPNASEGPTESDTVALQTFHQQMTALAAGELDTYMGFYREDVIARDPQYLDPLQGPAAVREDLDGLFTAYPDGRFEIHRVLGQGDVVAAELVFTGSNTGPLVLPDGTTVPPTGRPVRFPLSVFNRMDADGQILEENRYYDLASIIQQLEVDGTTEW
jgi:steroid delta-isomerase-like uncharacterized protein